MQTRPERGIDLIFFFSPCMCFLEFTARTDIQTGTAKTRFMDGLEFPKERASEQMPSSAGWIKQNR